MESHVVFHKYFSASMKSVLMNINDTKEAFERREVVKRLLKRKICNKPCALRKLALAPSSAPQKKTDFHASMKSVFL